MLTGAQVTEPLRVFMVSQSGDVADVTLKSSCRSADESVLKVSVTQLDDNSQVWGGGG